MNISFLNKISKFKKSKKDTTFLNELKLESTPKYKEPIDINIEYIEWIYNNEKSERIFPNINFNQIKNNNFNENNTNYFENIMKRILIAKNTKSNYTKFKKTLVYYKLLFIKLYETREEINKIKLDKEKWLRMDEHGCGHNSKNITATKKNNSFYIQDIDDNRHINELLFDNFYKNVNTILENIILFYLFLLDCYTNKKIPKVICDLHDDFNYDIRNIIDIICNKIIIYTEFDICSCFFDNNKKLAHPLRLQLSFNNHTKKYRLQYDDDTKYLVYDNDQEKTKLMLLKENYVDWGVKKNKNKL
jgi:hypothetical protein